MKTHSLLYSLTALCGLAGFVPVASAGDIPCPANLHSTTVDGSVVIRSTCLITGSTIKGNVLLHPGGGLIARDVTIEGSIQAAEALFLDVAGSSVNGNIQLDGLGGGDSLIVGTRVGGSIQLKANRSAIDVLDNQVVADVTAFDNTGGVLIAGNRMGGNLQCKGNQPAPTGGNNMVGGNREDQCANLEAAGAPGGGGGGGGGSGAGGLAVIEGDVHCPAGLGAVRVTGNVIVVGDCVLTGTAVQGNVLVQAGGSLQATDARVEGNIQAMQAAFVDVQSSRVVGNIQLDDLLRDSSRVVGSHVGGSVQLKNNVAALAVQGNGVGGDVQAFGNRGGLDITDNSIGGNLQCKDNMPAPTGSGNTVRGNREDQCANLQPRVAAATPSAAGSPSQNAAGASASADGASGGGSSGVLLLVGLLALITARLFTRSTGARTL